MTNLDLAKTVKNLYASLTNAANNGKLAKVNTATGGFDFIDPSTLGGGGGGTTTSVTGGNYPVINLAATVSAATMNSTLSGLAGMTVLVDKMYTVDGSVTVPANTTLMGLSGEFGFKLSGTATTLLNLSAGSRLSNLTLDGNKGSVTGSYSFSVALARAVTGSAKSISIEGCAFKNYGGMAVYGLSIAGMYVRRCTFDGIERNALMTQKSDNVYFENNRITGGPTTVQFHGKDGSGTYTAKNFRCVNNLWDLSNFTLAASDTILFVETWGGTEDVLVHGNRMYAPNTDNSNTVFGISLDYTRYAVVSSNYIDGGNSKLLGYGLEAAGAIDCTYINNTVTGYKGIGLSVSRNETRNIKFISNIIENARDSGANSACQLINGITDVLFDGNTFRDFGSVGIRFNGTGTGTTVINNRFYILTQTYAAVCLFNQGAQRIIARDNRASPEFQVGVTNGAGYIKRFLDSDNTTNSLISGNYVNGMIANGATNGASTIGVNCYSNTNSNIIENNIFHYMNIGVQTESSTTAPGNLISRNKSAGNVNTLVQSQNSNDKVITALQ